jgi:NADP-dependent 3-hydroxy acid dehydrogenase YdfG
VNKRVVLISGGSSGVGRAIAERLKADWNVVIFATNEAKTKAAADEMGCSYEVGDVSQDDDVRRIVTAVIAKHGGLDCVVNNAGIFAEGELEGHDPAAMRRMMDVNTLGTMFLTRAALPHMKERKAGVIVNIISQAGLYARGNYPVYTASKWAVTGFTKSLQQELAPFGIRVTGIYPGLVRTNIFSAAGVPMTEEDWKASITPQNVADAVAWVLALPEHVVVPELGIKHIAE